MRSGRFSAQIYDRSKRAAVWLGAFHTAVEAAKAYDEAAFQMDGVKAKLNFPRDLGEGTADAGQ